MTDNHVTIVGGGIAGLASAAALARDHDVTLFERDAIAGDTTARASGVISLPLEPIDEDTQRFIRERITALANDGHLEVEAVPAVRLLTDDATATIGGDHHDIDGLHSTFPGVFGPLDGYTGGAVLDGSLVLDPLDLAMAYKREAEAAGATILRDRLVEGLRVEDETVTGVETDLGPVDADSVVWATGHRVTDQLAAYTDIPTRPMRWNALVIRHDIDGAVPIGSDPTNRLYWRPYGDDALLVGGNEHLLDETPDIPSLWRGEAAATKRSFLELTEYAGGRAAERAPVDPEFIDLVEASLPTLLDIDPPLEIIRQDACPSADAASPDGLPIIDAPEDAPEGLVVVTGSHGRGIMLSPATGAAVRSLITDETAPISLEPYRLDRFDTRSRGFDYVSHWSA